MTIKCGGCGLLFLNMAALLLHQMNIGVGRCPGKE